MEPLTESSTFIVRAIGFRFCASDFLETCIMMFRTERSPYIVVSDILYFVASAAGDGLGRHQSERCISKRNQGARR